MYYMAHSQDTVPLKTQTDTVTINVYVAYSDNSSRSWLVFLVHLISKLWRMDKICTPFLRRKKTIEYKGMQFGNSDVCQSTLKLYKYL